MDGCCNSGAISRDSDSMLPRCSSLSSTADVIESIALACRRDIKRKSDGMKGNARNGAKQCNTIRAALLINKAFVVLQMRVTRN